MGISGMWNAISSPRTMMVHLRYASYRRNYQYFALLLFPPNLTRHIAKDKKYKRINPTYCKSCSDEFAVAWTNCTFDTIWAGLCQSFHDFQISLAMARYSSSPEEHFQDLSCRPCSTKPRCMPLTGSTWWFGPAWEDGVRYTRTISAMNMRETRWAATLQAPQPSRD